MNAIEVCKLSKRYGDRRGIEDVTLAVPAGAMFGFIGPNGAGKTTTIRLLLGLIAPTSGEARLFGVSCTDAHAREGVGYAPGDPQLAPGLTTGRLLAFLGALQPTESARRRTELARRFELDLDAPTDELSLGTKKKVALIAALQHAPRLVVLDEPTSALDPVVRSRLFDVLRDEVDRGATVFLSSHVLSEVEALCRTVAAIADGRVVAVEDVSTLRDRTARRVLARFDGGGSYAALARLAQQLQGVEQLECHGAVISFLYRGAMPPLLDALAASSPADVRIEGPSLEDVFFTDYMARGNARAA